MRMGYEVEVDYRERAGLYETGTVDFPWKVQISWANGGVSWVQCESFAALQEGVFDILTHPPMEVRLVVIGDAMWEWGKAVRAALDAGHEVHVVREPGDAFDFRLLWETGCAKVSFP